MNAYLFWLSTSLIDMTIWWSHLLSVSWKLLYLVSWTADVWVIFPEENIFYPRSLSFISRLHFLFVCGKQKQNYTFLNNKHSSTEKDKVDKVETWN